MSITRLLNARRISSSGVLASAGRGYVYDADAETYIAAVEAADGEKLEFAVRQAISQFVAGCKTDGIWTPIKASCILCGARTLTGALTPLVGAAPTSFNFVSGDYSRKDGLKGNGTTKYLDSGRNNNADPQNSKHLSVYVTDAVAGGNLSNSGTAGVSGRTGIALITATGQSSANSLTSFDAAGDVANSAVSNSLMGVSRSASGSFTFRSRSSDLTVSVSSTTPNNGNHFILARNASTVDLHSASRICFYSIGESITLSLLDSRVSILRRAIEAAL